MPAHEKTFALLEGNLFSTFYQLQLSSNRRFHTTFTLVFISAPSNDSEQWESYLKKRIRDTDIAFKFPEPHPYQILLTNANEREAEFFVTRVLEGWEAEGYTRQGILSSILEISSGQSPIEAVIETGRNALLSMAGSELSVPVPITVDHSFSKREQVSIKVSILEEDHMVTRVLSNLLERSVIEGVAIDLRVFHDGDSFLSSDWYQSPHSHIVILNDILPKKNGVEVLQALRAMPNERKFHIFMMTKRMTENEMIYAYEKGVDEYIIKPFNPKLFEAQVKKVLGRLYT